MDGDMLGMAFQIAKEYGLKETLKMFLNMAPEPPALVDVQEGFHAVVRGDHLVYKTEIGWNIHFYVVDNLRDGRLKVCGYFLEGNDNLLIEEELIFKPEQTHKIKVEERILCKANVTQKLKKKLYDQISSLHDEEYHIDVFRKERSNYDFLNNNSEHFINFVKVGEAKCHVTQEIECFIRNHIFVLAIHKKPVKAGITDSNWAAILGTLCEIILKSSDVKPSIRATLRDCTLTKVPKVASQAEASGSTRPKATAVPPGNFTTKEYANRGGRATAIQTTKCSSKEITKGEGISTVVGARKSATKKSIKVGGKANACTIQATKLEGTTKILRGEGKIIPDQIAKDASSKVLTRARKHPTKKVIKIAGKTIILQISAAKEIEKEARSTNAKGTRSRAKVMVKTGRYTTLRAAKNVNVRNEGQATEVQVKKKLGMASYAVQSKQSLNKKGEEITMVQARNKIAEETAKGGEKAATPNGVTAKEKIITNQPTNIVGDEIVKEGEEVTTDQATNNTTTNGQIVKQKEKDTLLQTIENSLTDDVAQEGGKATAVQATKSAATVAIQGVSKEAFKHGTRHTTTFVAKNAATTAIKHTANATVVAGLVVEGALYSANMGKAIYEYSKGEMDNEEFVDFAVEQTATSGGSTAGGISGSLAGIAAGAAIGSVIPVIGTVIGGTIGGFAGGISGGIGGTLLGKEIGKLINLERKKTADDAGQMNAE